MCLTNALQCQPQIYFKFIVFYPLYCQCLVSCNKMITENITMKKQMTNLLEFNKKINFISSKTECCTFKPVCKKLSLK